MTLLAYDVTLKANYTSQNTKLHLRKTLLCKAENYKINGRLRTYNFVRLENSESNTCLVNY